MDDSLDRHVKDSSPRRLLRNFMEVTEPKDTPAPLRNQAAALKERPPKGTLSSSKQRSRASRSSTGGENLHSEVIRRQAGQSSFMDQTLSVSVIQGINQTYANIVAPDSDNSSVNSSIDLEKGAKFRKQKKRKLETAPLPAEMMTRPPLKKKKKKKKTVVPSSDTTEEAAPRQDFITDNTMVQETEDVEAQDKPKGLSTEGGTAGEMLRSMPPEATSPKEGAAHPVDASASSPDVSSISALSTRSDATYDFSAVYDDTLSNIMETKRRFGNQITSRKLNLPSLIGTLQAKQKSAIPVTVADIVETLNDPEVQVTSPEKASQEPLVASDEELNNLHSPSQNVDDDAIPPPLSFRDNEASRSTILREANFTGLENTSKILLHLEESDDDMGQDQLPKTPAPPEDEDLVMDLQRSASASQGKSLGQVIDSSTIKTPTRSSPRKSVGQITDATPTRSSLRNSVSQASDATTPTRSPRKSVGQVTDATTIRTPTRSSLGTGVGQITDATTITTPTRSSPRRNVSQVIATMSTPGRSVGQVTDVATMKTPTRSSLGTSVGQITDATTTTTPTRSSPRRNLSQVIATKSTPGRSVGQVTNVTTMKTPTRSSPRSVGQVNASKSLPRKSVGQVTNVTTMKIPTRSSPRRSVGQVSPSRSSPRRSLGHVSASKSSPRRSLAQVIASKSSPRRSVGQVIASKSSPRKSVAQVSASKSSPRRSLAQVSASKSSPRRSVGHVSPSKSSPRKSMAQVSASKSSPRRSLAHVSASKSSPRRSLAHVIASKSSPRRSVGHVSPSKSSPRKSVAQVSASKSSPRKSLAHVIASKSSPRRSVGHVSPSKSSPRKSVSRITDVSTMKTPTKSSPRKSVSQVTDVTTMETPTKSSPERSVGQVSASKSSPRRSVGQVTDVTTTKTPTRSSPRSMSQVSVIITPIKLTPRNMGQVSASKSSPRRSVAQVTDVTTTKTPTRSSPRSMVQVSASKSSPRSMDQVTDATTTTKTPTRSSSRRSVGQVTDVTTTKTPTRSSPRSLGQVDASITTPTRSSPRQSLGRNKSSVLVSPQMGDTVDNTVTGGSLGRSRNAQARQIDATAIISVASPAEESDEVQKEESPKKRSRTSKSLPEDDAESTSLSDIENDFSLIPVTVRPSLEYIRDARMGAEEEVETSRETSPLSIEALPSLQETSAKEQPSAPSSTAKVRQMTMREFLEQLKTKPVQPPLPKPKPLLPTLLGTAVPSTSQPKPRGRPKGKAKGKKKQLPASLPQRLTKEVFTHFAKCRVTKGALAEVMKITEIFWENLTKDVCAMQTTKKNPTKSIQHQDVEKLMKRQGLITTQESLDALVEQLLPMEMWSMFKTFPEPAQNPFPSFTGPLFNP